MFGELPKRFKTPERLVIAIDNSKRETNCYIDEETEQSLLTVEVCKAFIRRNGNCPEFPENVWTREFVDYCMEHGTSFPLVPPDAQKVPDLREYASGV